jgi:hypothetical protein
MRRAWSRPSNNQKRVGVPFALPPLLDQLSKSPEIVYFVADSYLSCRHSMRFGFIGRGTLRRAIHARTSARLRPYNLEEVSE